MFFTSKQLAAGYGYTAVRVQTTTGHS